MEEFEKLFTEKSGFVKAMWCEDQACEDLIKEKLSLTDEDFHIGYIGPGIGAAVGPGMIGVYFYGKEVTLDSLAK